MMCLKLKKAAPVQNVPASKISPAGSQPSSKYASGPSSFASYKPSSNYASGLSYNAGSGTSTNAEKSFQVFLMQDWIALEGLVEDQLQDQLKAKL